LGFIIVLYENTMSSAVNGTPSCHFIPSFILNVYVSLSSEIFHDSARSGMSSSVLLSRLTRVSYTFPPLTTLSYASVAVIGLSVAGSALRWYMSQSPSAGADAA